MKAVVIRTGSITGSTPVHSGSPRVSISRNDSLSGVFSRSRSTVSSPRISLHFDVNRGRRDKMIRRALSESDMLRSEAEVSGKSRAFQAKNQAGIWPESRIPVEEERLSGESCRIKNTSTVEKVEQRKIGAYYREMLKSNPGDPLLLRNYGKFLHEVEKDSVGAEEYYCRGILASPGDGDLLSLYGKLIWETQRDEDRAKSYFDQAVSASPHDCMVLGSYAQFMWEADEDEDNDEEINNNNSQVLSPALVPAF